MLQALNSCPWNWMTSKIPTLTNQNPLHQPEQLCNAEVPPSSTPMLILPVRLVASPSLKRMMSHAAYCNEG